ncbi:MAG: hypothetical protein HWE16_13355 [Gammaproteobacteria bacterium]|nr:hypothetical protein [Gammaproteobacteria bacterium]
MKRVIIGLSLLCFSVVVSADNRYAYCLGWFADGFEQEVVKRVYTDVIKTDKSLATLTDSFNWHMTKKYKTDLGNKKYNYMNYCRYLNTRIKDKADTLLDDIINKHDHDFFYIPSYAELITKEEFLIEEDI